jgi:hypothetical protein
MAVYGVRKPRPYSGITVTAEIKYRDIYQYMSSFLNELYQEQASSLITCKKEKECVKQALGNKGPYYQIISDRLIHKTTKKSIAESVLCTDITAKHIWINMYKIVFNEKPKLADIVVDPIPEDTTT